MNKRNLKKIGLVMATVIGLTQGFIACAKPEDHFKKAERLSAQGNPSDALVLYNKALAKSQDPWALRANLGKARTLNALKRPKEAYAPASRALQLAKNDSDAVEATALWGNVAMDAGDWIEASRALAMLGKRGSGYPARARLEERLAKRGTIPVQVAVAPAKPIPPTKAVAVPTVLPTPAKTIAPTPMPSPVPKAPVVVAPIAVSRPVTSASSDPVGNLNAMRMGLASVSEITSINAKNFPWISQFQDPRQIVKIPSPNGQRLLWRAVDKKGYYLFVSDAAGKQTQKIEACKNAFQPVWSPDSNKVLFSAIDWKTKVRNLYVYDFNTKLKSVAFASKRRVGALAAWSPDGSKIVFTYFGELWIMNANGIGRGMLPLAKSTGQDVGEAALFAWSNDGAQLIYKDLNTGKRYLLRLASKLEI